LCLSNARATPFFQALIEESVNMSKLPYFPFYVSDFKGATDYLDLEDVGLYVRMLCLLWETPTCSFPNDFNLIKKRLLIKDNDFDARLKIILKDFFTLKRGKYTQKRLMQEYVKANDTFNKYSNAGKKGAKAKSLKSKKKGSSDEQAMNKPGLSDEQASKPISKSIIKNTKKESFSLKGNLPEGFTEFRHKYPVKKNTDWSNGLECFVKWMNKGISLEQMLFSIKFWSWSDDDGFKPHPKALLNKELWKNMGDQPKPLKIVNGLPWELFLTKFKEDGIWYVPDMGPYPTTDKKPDGPLNPDCNAPPELIKQILNVGDLL